MLKRGDVASELDGHPAAWVLLIDRGARLEPQVQLFWREADAIEAAERREQAEEHLVVERVPITGNRYFEGDIDDRPRCRACREPIELEDTDDPDSWVHCRDAIDLGSHTAER